MKKVQLVQPKVLKGFYLIYSLGNEGTLSTVPVVNKTHETNETASQVCNNVNESMAASPFSKVKNYKLQNPKISKWII